MYQTSDSDNLVWHVITQAAEYSKDWKLVKKLGERNSVYDLWPNGLINCLLQYQWQLLRRI